MKTIEITVDIKGEIVVQTKGFAGSACKDTSRLLEQALGEKTAEQMTAEFYHPPSVQEHQRAENG